MGRLRAKHDYESLRDARITRNKVPISFLDVFSLFVFRERERERADCVFVVRFTKQMVKAILEEALGLNRSGGGLPSIISSTKSIKRVRGSIIPSTQIRRSVRLKAISSDLDPSSSQGFKSSSLLNKKESCGF